MSWHHARKTSQYYKASFTSVKSEGWAGLTDSKMSRTRGPFDSRSPTLPPSATSPQCPPQVDLESLSEELTVWSGRRVAKDGDRTFLGGKTCLVLKDRKGLGDKGLETGNRKINPERKRDVRLSRREGDYVKWRSSAV